MTENNFDYSQYDFEYYYSMWENEKEQAKINALEKVFYDLDEKCKEIQFIKELYIKGTNPGRLLSVVKSIQFKVDRYNKEMSVEELADYNTTRQYLDLLINILEE